MDIRFGALGVFFHLVLTIYNMPLYFFRLIKVAFNLARWTMDASRCPLKHLVRTVSAFGS